MICTYCSIDLHFQCSKPLEDSFDCCCKDQAMATPVAEFKRPDIISIRDAFKAAADSDTPRRVGAPAKEGKDMKAILATGRKRANAVKPIEKGVTICEWSGLKNAGGGVEPIVGCQGNFARAVHHGPNKSVLANEPSNLHAICAFCHNRWHARNDKYYSGIRPTAGTDYLPSGDYKPHDPGTRATEEELIENELQWEMAREASRHGRKRPEKVSGEEQPECNETFEDSEEFSDELGETIQDE